MKSLNDRYTESHHNTHETFADLIFCALVVLVLFVMMLAIEVSQRVRASQIKIVEVEAPEDIKSLSVEEVADLSRRLQKQQAQLEAQSRQMEEMRRQTATQASAIQNKLAALSGEQRFTGATEPSSILVAYDYKQDRFVFIRRKEFDHATTRTTSESDLEYSIRQTRELVDLALASRKQRFFTAAEANRLYAAFTKYQQINPTDDGYTLSTERINVNYSTGLSGYIAGDKSISRSAQAAVELAVATNLEMTNGDSDAMYPSAKVKVLVADRMIEINGVTLSPKEFKDLLLSFGGRGAMLDFEGYDGPAPKWLVDDVLTPTGYIGKTPKLPVE